MSGDERDDVEEDDLEEILATGLNLVSQREDASGWSVYEARIVDRFECLGPGGLQGITAYSILERGEQRRMSAHLILLGSDGRRRGSVTIRARDLRRTIDALEHIRRLADEGRPGARKGRAA